MNDISTNIFDELLKYASYTEKMPRENILTGGLVFLLKKNPKLKYVFLKELLNKYKVKYPRFNFPYSSLRTLSISSQTTHRRGIIDSPFIKLATKDIIDIEIGDKEHKYGIFIENKIGASFGSYQAFRYRKSLNKQYENGMLVFITLTGAYEIDEEINSIQIKWSDVFALFSKYLPIEKNMINKYLLENFLNYMKGEDMDTFEGFSKSDLGGKALLRSSLSLMKMEKVFGELRSLLKENGYKLNPISWRYDGISFTIVPLKANIRKWKKNRSWISIAIYAYFKELEQKEFDPQYEEGIYPGININKHSPFKLTNKQVSHLRRSGIGVYENNKYLYNDIKPLHKIIKKEKNPEKQARLLMGYYLKALNAYEKAGVIRQLYS